MNASTYLRVGLMGAALLGFMFGPANAGMSNKSMKDDGMKSEATMETPMKTNTMKSKGTMEKPMKTDAMKSEGTMEKPMKTKDMK